MSDDIRVPRAILIDALRLIVGRAARGNDEAKRTEADLTRLLAAPPAAQDEQPYFDYNAVHGIPAAQPTGELEFLGYVNANAIPRIGEGLYAMVWESADQASKYHDNFVPDGEAVKVYLKRPALDTQTAQPGSAQDFSDLAALEGPLGTAELYLRMIEPDDPDTSVPDGLAAARKRLALHVSLTPQPVTPVEGKVTDEMIERARLALLSEMGTVECCRQTYMDIPDQDAMRAELDAAKVDAERLDWFEQQADEGCCPALLNDDNGHWAVSFDGFQNVPMQDEPEDIQTSFLVEAKDWHATAREAIDTARSRSETGEKIG